MLDAKKDAKVEPWLRGTHREIAPVQRAMLHALELAWEDVERWVSALNEEELAMEPHGLPSVAFQVRHLARSIDRILTYAEGNGLSEMQFDALRTEAKTAVHAADLRAEFARGMEDGIARMLRFRPESFGEERGVGRAKLPTTVAGLLIHLAEHTQRHVGQTITTAKVVMALREAEQS